jgi:hypothetical protein
MRHSKAAGRRAILEVAMLAILLGLVSVTLFGLHVYDLHLHRTADLFHYSNITILRRSDLSSMTSHGVAAPD